MSELGALPNVGKVLESSLNQIGIETPEQLREMGVKQAFIRIRAQVDPGACVQMLYGLQGAVDGIPDKLLSSEVKLDLRMFFKSL
ncbi:TfoX/Sxy family protein [Eubacteriales bacterium OttesenSCG-928-N13]|nr:TfoX/Sxy family protein [Eubacteriales bacterium OttesenSCG-928-N13]